MNDPNSPELDHLEELDSPELGDAAPPPAAPAPMPMTMGAQPAHKQLYQFLWGGIAVLFGCLLPFHKAVTGWNAEHFDPLVTGPIGLMTFGGGVVAFAAILFIGAQLFCIKYRRVMLGPIGLMACVCAWSWLSFFDGGEAKNLGFKTSEEVGTVEWDDAYNQFLESPKGLVNLLHDGQYISDYFTHIGPGYLFTLAGSTYVMLIFLCALLGIGQGKKKAAPASAAGGGKGRGGARRR